MSTNSAVLTDALRLAGPLSETDSLSAEQGEAALRTANDLFAEWDAQGIDIGWFPQTSLQATCPIYTDAMLAAKYALALAMCTEYGVEPKPIVASIAGTSYNRIQRDTQVSKLKAADMSHLPGVVEQSNIENG